MYASTIGSIWDQAAENRADARRIVIIGYSFPRTDTRALTLLKDSLSRRPGEISVELIAPDATAIVSRIDESVLSLAKNFTPVATAIHFGPAVKIGAAFGTWGWWFGSGFLWPSHAILIDHRPWERVWVGRDIYVHPYAHPWVHPVGPRVEVHHPRW
jgi:hypothetical protein